MKFLTYLIYGLVSGFSELVPVSAPAHRYLVQYLFGLEGNTEILNVFVHIGTLMAIIIALYPTLSKIRKERRHSHRSAKQRRVGRDLRSFYDLRIVKTATLPMTIGFLMYAYWGNHDLNLVLFCIMFILCGSILLLCDYMRHGNKDSRHISALDSIGIGIACAFSAIPGISRVAMALSVATVRGADRTHAYHWALMLSIPALFIFIVLDFFAAVAVGAATVTFTLILLCFAAAAASFAGAYAAITFMNYLAVRTGFAGIAYYNIGVGIFSFILYLIT